MGKLIFLGIIIFIIYIIASKKLRNNSSNKDSIDKIEMIECSVCKTYVTNEEAITKKGKVFCSYQCLQKGE